MTTPVCTIDATGIHAPPFSDCNAYYVSTYEGIFAPDVYLGNDSQDAQWLGILALALSDVNSTCVAVYNSFSPATAIGAGLSSVVKINGIKRASPTFSNAAMLVVGQAGTVIDNGLVGDANGNTWILPTTLTIPGGGSLVTTAVCTTAGAIAAPVGTITNIQNSTRGWQSATNTADATVGEPVEQDGPLRIRQQQSTALPSRTVLGGIVGAIELITGVARLKAYENDTDTPDSNGLPEHSIALVVDGGDTQTIGNTIALKKTPGAYTYGTTDVIVIDSVTGAPSTIRFSRPISVTISVLIQISIAGLEGYSSVIGDEIVAAVVAYIMARPIAGDEGYLRRTRLFVPAQLAGPYATPLSPNDANTYELVDVLITRSATTTLDGAITSGTSPIVVHGFSHFPAAGSYIVQIDSEKLLVTAGQGTLSWTVTRGYQSTTPASHADNAPVTALESETDIALDFNEATECTTGDVTLTVAT